MKGSINPVLWKEMLRDNLPGEEAQQKMAPTFRGSFEHQNEPVHAAVLVLMYPCNGQTNLVFIKRNEYDGPHSAQISFPGGVRESGDRSLEDTAIRETREELGILSRFEVLGSLTQLHISVSNFLVFPFIGWMDHTPAFSPDKSEVQYIIEVSIAALLDPANQESETINRNGLEIEAPFYRVGKEKIWGATAMMLSEVLQLASMQQ